MGWGLVLCIPQESECWWGVVIVMSVNPLEEQLRRLTMVKAIVRKEIDTTNDLRKKEIYRKKYERLDSELEDLLYLMRLW